MNEKFIQGIKLDDIQKYEDKIQIKEDPKKISRKISRGISRGISYDSESESHFDDKIKKDFLNEFIQANENSTSQYKRFLDFIYFKTSKRNFLRLNQSTKSILDVERYFAACLFKQLGLITICLDLNKIVSITPTEDFKNIELPSRLFDLWKKNIYPLRNKLLYAFQRSHSSSNSNSNSNPDSQSFIYKFKEYSEEIKNKCILLLYSDPILKFKDKGDLNNETFESAMKSIFSFVTSKSPLSDISKIIDIQRKRLDISRQSLNLILPFVNQNSMFNSSKTIFILAYDCISIGSICKGLNQHELDDYENLLGSFSLSFIQNLFVQPSYPIIFNPKYLYNLLYYHKDNDSRNKCASLIINQLKWNKNNKSSFHDRINFTLISLLAIIAIKSKNIELTEYIISLLSQDDLDLFSKELILIMIPLIIQTIPDNSKLLNESMIFSLLEQNSKNPVVVKYMFYWISSLFTSKNLVEYRDFILKVLKGIGQSIIGKSCLFIDDSFAPLSHRQVSETMISFIRLLFNSKNELLFDIINDILRNTLKEVISNKKEDEMILLIGLFASLGTSSSSLEPDRHLIDGIKINSSFSINGYNKSNDDFKLENRRSADLCNTNVVLLKYVDFDLNDEEIDNILQLHEFILHSKHFIKNKDIMEINEIEIIENILVSTFYSFLSIIMQNTNNMKILLNEKNMKRTLSICEIANLTTPSNENSLLILSHYLEQSITNSLYNTVNNDNWNDSFKFMKMNFGEIKNDVIKTNKNYTNIFLCNRIFDFENETYFNIKVDNIDSHTIFIGFIDSEEISHEKSFGFEKKLHNHFLNRKSPSTAISDQIPINDIKSIGCYYTTKYVYLLINEKLTSYRISHPTLKSYIPIIYVDCDELEITVLQNATFVDHSNDKFNFLNTQNISYEKNDIKEIEFKIETVENSNYQTNYLIIGQQFYISLVKYAPSFSDSNDAAFPTSLIYYENNPGVIKDILIDENDYSSININAEIYSRKSLSREVVNFDGKYQLSQKTNYFNLVENRTNTRFGINSSVNVKHLQKTSTDLNSIRKYIKSKTINDNSKSIAIIMSRYLVFIILDYLRFSKSNLLQEEGINSNESQILINSLAHSLPTITTFSSSFKQKLDENIIVDDYLIFQDEQTEKTEETEERNNNIKSLYKLAGNCYFFNISFIIFMKKSEQLISPKFLIKLIQASYEIANKEDLITHSYLYDLISSKYKIESCYPLPKQLKIDKKVTINDYCINFDYQTKTKNNRKVIGIVPILLSSIPDQLPSAVCYNKSIRFSSDKTSYFATLSSFYYDVISMNWKYDINDLKNKYKEYSYDQKDYKGYELKLGFFVFYDQLPEFIAKSSFGFIHILLSIFRCINYSEFLYQKHKKYLDTIILDKIFSLILRKNPLVYPFVEPIILAFSSSSFSNILSSKDAIESFSILSSFSNILYPINKFPSLINETPLIFCIYSSLIKAFNLEKSISSSKSNKEILSLFDDFVEINNELFDVFDIDKIYNSEFTEGTVTEPKRQIGNAIQTAEKKKNYRLFYQLYYYSILLNNENNLPYPKFLFYHDWIRQHFGSFRIAITQDDISKFDIKNKNNKEIHFKSEEFNNDSDLEISCKLINIFKISKQNRNNFNEYEGEKRENSFKIFVHQLVDDKQIEIPQTGEKVSISFPLEILIYNHDENYQKQLKKGDSFIIDFSPSKEKQKQYFIDHYDEFQDDFNQFILLGKYDTQLSKFAIDSKGKKDKKIAEDSSPSNTNNNDTDVILEELYQHNPHLRNVLNDPRFLSFYLNCYYEVNSLEELSKKFNKESNRNDFKFYELDKIPSKIDFNLELDDESTNFKKSIISLRYWILSNYSILIEEILINYTEKTNYFGRFRRVDDFSANWSIQFSLSDKNGSLYSQQIIRPAFSMNTESKFRFISQILMNEAKEESETTLDFNRFEARKFFDKEASKSNEKNRPLLIQFMMQIDVNNLDKLKVHRGNPFIVNLIGEKAIDAGGPSREIFSNLIIEIMNDKIGIFTFNPNHRNDVSNTNKEDLIPNIIYNGDIYNESSNDDSINYFLDDRFLYAGALIAVCIVSDLPQQMKLASFVWEYLTKNKIENVEVFYEIDEDFKNLMKEAENCKQKLETSQMSEEEFNNVFIQSFKIKDSFGNQVDLVPSGSKKKVTPENISQFIELSKNFRMHEFDYPLNSLKKGFDIVMTKTEITSILRPNELKLLVCGEPNCPIEQMKNVIIVDVQHSESHVNDFNEYSAKMTKMFWNVMESFSIDERIAFIRFTSGSNGLPATGLRWQDDLKVIIISKEESLRTKKVLPESHTCFSSVDIFYFESEEQLAKSLRTAIQDGGLITDDIDIPEGIENFL